LPRAWAIFSFLFVLHGSFGARAETKLDGPFYYRFGEATPAHAQPGEGWTRAKRLSDIPKRGGDSLWVDTAIEPVDGHRPTLMVPAVYVRFLAYFDGELIGGDDSGAAAGRAFHLVPLTTPNRGWLSLHVMSDYTKTGFRGDLSIGSEAELVTAIVRRDAGRAALVVVFLLIAFGSFILAVRTEERLAYLGLAMWSACAAIWTGFYTAIRDLLWPQPSFWIAAWAISLAGASPSLLLYLREVLFGGDRQARGARIVHGFLVANVVSSAVGLSMLAFSVPASTSNAFWYLHRTLVGLTAVIIATMLGIRARQGDVEAQALGAGMLVYMVFAVRDVLVSLAVIDEAQVITPWGIFVLVVCAAWVLRRRVDKLRQRALQLAGEVVVHAQEREMMLRDMHDGVGRITTSISMFRSRGQRRDPDVHARAGRGGGRLACAHRFAARSCHHTGRRARWHLSARDGRGRRRPASEPVPARTPPAGVSGGPDQRSQARPRAHGRGQAAGEGERDEPQHAQRRRAG
jgi:hypothetical protein